MTFHSRTKRGIAVLISAAMLLHSVGAAAAATFQYRIPLKGGSATYNPAKGEITDLVATPTSVVAGSGTTVAVVARVQDKGKLPATPGQSVEWSASGGSFVQGVTTTARGAATGVFVPPETVGIYTVTGALTSNAATRSTTVQVVANAQTAVVTSLSSSKPAITVGGQLTTMSAVVRDAYGNPLGAGVPVHWTTDRGTLSAETSSTDTAGQANVTLASSVQAGRARVSARAIASDAGLATDVAFEADSANARAVEVGTDKDTLVADGAATAQLTARIQDAHGNPVGAGVTVNWVTDQGSVSPASTTTQADGVATATLKSGTVAGVATARATAASGDAGSAVAVTYVANMATARVASIVASAPNLMADGVSTTGLTATVRDVNGNPLGAGVTVRWTTDRGALSSATSTTNASGTAVVTLTASTIAGPANITALGAAGDAGKSTTVTFTSDAASAMVAAVSANGTFIPANGTAQAHFSATLVDARGNTAPAGVTVRWATTAGTLSSATSQTDANGVAWVTLTAGTAKTVATVTARGIASDVGKTRNISFDADATTARVVWAGSNVPTIFGNNSAAATISAAVQDAYGNALGAGVAVTWSTTQGALSAATSWTNADGATSVVLRSGGSGVGPTATVTARGVAGDAGRSAAVTFTSDARWQFSSGLAFDGTPQQGGQNRNVVVYNIGTTPEAPTLTPTGYFGLVSGCGVIQPGGSCTLTIGFYPPSSGDFYGTLTASGPGGSSATNLSGQGLATAWNNTMTGVLSSQNGYYQARMQGDCNFVVYGGGNAATHVVWKTDTTNRTHSCFLAMQGDGNLVIYGAAGAIWNIGQHPTVNGSSWLEMGNDGRLYFWGDYIGVRNNLIWTS